MKSGSKLLGLLLAISLIGANPAFARKNSMAGMFGDAVESVVESHASVTLPATGSIEVAFSPHGGCTAATVRFIGEAKQSIRLAAYGLTSNPIGKALVEARQRGIDVRVVVDKEHNGRRNSGNSIVDFLAANGIPVRIDKAVRIQHNKVVIIDGQSVQNGSFNFTAAAQTSNAENVIIHRASPNLAKVFTENWERLWAQSQEYRSRY